MGSGSSSADEDGGAKAQYDPKDLVYDPYGEAYIPYKRWKQEEDKHHAAVAAAYNDKKTQKATVHRRVVGTADVQADIELPFLFFSSVEFSKEVIAAIDTVARDTFKYDHVRDRRQGQHAQCPDVGYQLQWREGATATGGATLRTMFPSDIPTPEGRRRYEEFLAAVRADNYNIYIG